MTTQTAHLEWRYATKLFDPTQSVSDADFALILDAMRLAPTSFGLQPFRVVHLANRGLRERLKPLFWNQSQITDASHLLVIQTVTTITPEMIDDHIKRIASVRSVPVADLEGYRGMMGGMLLTHPAAKAWAQRQAYLAMGFGLEMAASLQVDTCPIEGVDTVACDALLAEAIPLDGYETVVLVAVGYRSESDKYQHAPKVRVPMTTFCVTVG
ncbi:NAD(P)H-dependent oxidoreductase [bacterium]|nr:NAD(P)H-dependent oxidoreductase [bacterium]